MRRDAIQANHLYGFAEDLTFLTSLRDFVHRSFLEVFRMMDLIDKIIRPDAMVVKSQAADCRVDAGIKNRSKRA